MPNKKEIIVIVGPTASGKSDIANLLGSKINGEVVSADSMQIYKGMDIGTGKILPNEMLVKHWGLDIVNPDQAFSAALYQEYARNAFKDIWFRNKTPILCGGTGFYVRAAIDDYNFPKGNQTDNPIRQKYLEFAKKHGNHALWEQLLESDPKSANAVHENNVVRVVRALELHEQGKSYAHQVEILQNIPEKYPAKFFGLQVDPKILNDRINNRVDKMIEDGLVNEVEELLYKRYRNALTAASAIGYKEIVAALDGKCSLDEAIDQIKTSTRRYAKRQRTWFRKDKRINWINYDKVKTNKVVDEIINNF